MMARAKVKDYKKLEEKLGTMYHLLLNRFDEATTIKFCADAHYPKFATIHDQPVFFDHDKNFMLAIDYTIIYPKIYVKHAIPFKQEYLPLNRSYIQ